MKAPGVSLGRCVSRGKGDGGGDLSTAECGLLKETSQGQGLARPLTFEVA